MHGVAAALRASLALPGLLMAAAAIAAPSIDTMLGRMVPARADAPAVGAAHSPRSLFVLHCAGCHGTDGRGPRDSGVPDLRKLDAFLALPGGREFVIRVPGVMGSGLNDAEVAAVMNYLFASIVPRPLPAGHRAYDAAEIAAARAAPLKDIAKERSRLEAAARAAGTPLHGY